MTSHFAFLLLASREVINAEGFEIGLSPEMTIALSNLKIAVETVELGEVS